MRRYGQLHDFIQFVFTNQFQHLFHIIESESKRLAKDYVWRFMAQLKRSILIVWIRDGLHFTK